MALEVLECRVVGHDGELSPSQVVVELLASVDNSEEFTLAAAVLALGGRTALTRICNHVGLRILLHLLQDG